MYVITGAVIKSKNHSNKSCITHSATVKDRCIFMKNTQTGNTQTNNTLTNVSEKVLKFKAMQAQKKTAQTTHTDSTQTAKTKSKTVGQDKKLTLDSTQHTQTGNNTAFRQLLSAVNNNPTDTQLIYKLAIVVSLSAVNKFICVGGADEKTYNKTNTAVNRLYTFKAQILQFATMQNIDTTQYSLLYYTKTGLLKEKTDSYIKSIFERVAHTNLLDSDGANIVQNVVCEYWRLYKSLSTHTPFNLEQKITQRVLVRRVFPFGYVPQQTDYTTKVLTPIQSLYRIVNNTIRQNGQNAVYIGKKPYTYTEQKDSYGNIYYTRSTTLANDSTEQNDIAQILDSAQLSKQQRLYAILLYNGYTANEIAQHTHKDIRNITTQLDRVKNKLASVAKCEIIKAPKAQKVAVFVNGEYTNTFDSVRQCAKALHVSPMQITRCTNSEYTKDSLSFDADRIVTFKLIAQTAQRTDNTAQRTDSTQTAQRTQHTQRTKTYIDYMFSNYHNNRRTDSEQISIVYNCYHWIDSKQRYNVYMWAYTYKTPFTQRTAQTKTYI